MKKAELVAAFEAHPRASHLVMRIVDGTNIFVALRTEKGEVMASSTADSLGGAVRALLPVTQ